MGPIRFYNHNIMVTFASETVPLIPLIQFEKYR